MSRHFLAGAGGAVVGDDAMLQHRHGDLAHVGGFRADLPVQQGQRLGAEDEVLARPAGRRPTHKVARDLRGIGVAGPVGGRQDTA